MEILTNLNTVGTIYFNKLINTGDKLLDTSIITLVMILISAMCSYVYNNGRRIYNKIIYKIYGMNKKLFKYKDVPYWTKYIIDIQPTQFKENFRQEYGCYIICEYINSKYKKILSSLNLNNNPALQTILTNSKGDKFATMPQYNACEGILSLYHSICDIKIIDCCRLVDISENGNEIFMDYLYNIFCKDTNDAINFRNNLKTFLFEKGQEIIDEESNTNQKILVPKIKDATISYKIIGNVSNHKTFDKIFYDDKQKLLNILEKFQTKKMYPSNIPMDNKLGILLYGPPGTGKTGTISAIANALKRDIIIVNFTEIYTCQDFDLIFDAANFTKYIYVFDEFDCILDVMSNKKQEKSQDYGGLLLAAEGEERKEILKMIKEKSSKSLNINMAYLLQKLDGLETAEGRLIIATTNNPDKINPAILRPGRFDIKICLGNCSSTMYVDIISSFYNNDPKIRTKIINAKIKEFKHTPLELINTCIQETNIDKIIKKLKE